jgi:potassium efflux system protein
LRKQYGNLIRALALLESDKRQYLDKAEEVRAYAWERLLGFGMRSASPISVETVADIPGGLRWFFRGDHWVELGRALQGTATRTPVFSTAFVLVVIVLLITRRRIGAALERTATKVRRVSTDRYAYTGEALMWTFLLALPIPLLFGLTSWALQQAPDSSVWMQGIQDGLKIAAWISFVLAFLATVCRPGGLGASHFRWHEKPLARFRRAIRWFATIYIPALLITDSCLYEESADYLFTIGRSSLMLAQAWTAIVLWHVFHLSDGILARFMRENPNRLIARWRYLWVPLVLACPLALVVIAGLGCMITAYQLGLGLFGTAALIAGAVILYALTRRWFRVKQRKLSLAEALERRRARQAAAVSDGQQSPDVVAVDLEDEEKLDLVTISEQTRDLLRLLYSLCAAIAILYLWSGIFPLVATFEAISIPLVGGLTLLGLARAVLIAAVTYIAVRKLPGLLELAVLRTTKIDAGTRNAISTLCQYALIAIGLGLLFKVLRVDWAKLGWIAAALSVGIGFGLQEVVANFVCGIIVLFERPIRVGDFVTVDGTIGTVTKIRIRATTITNGERQEFIVPNKRLITGSLLNWTLNAAVNRITIRFGVACGSDTDKARQILRDIAADHPLVLADPAPMAIFEQFGDSSLNLVLYAYLPDLDNRTNTISELHTKIDKRFAAAGIDIPNPQFDFHLIREGDSMGG